MKQSIRAEALGEERRQRLFEVLKKLEEMGVKVALPLHDEVNIEIPSGVDEDRVMALVLEAMGV